MQETIDAFIERWKSVDGTERANYQLFLTDLCRLLDLPQPEPANSSTEENAYVFERLVRINHPDGTQTHGFIDLYRRDSFICEAKQSGRELNSSGWDKAMLRAQGQADLYARSLPAHEGRPPFIIVTDVGRSLELYSEFSRSGSTYIPFPDALSHRIRLQDLHKPEIRERLQAVWLDPLSLDPSRYAARVTRDIADHLAVLAKSLEADGHSPEDVAGFLMRALFTMFAEDIGLLPERGFTDLLASLQDDPSAFAPMLESLWAVMNAGGFSPALRKTILRFNGGLFSQPKALPLNKDQFALLLKASHADWQYVEPAIFGTLLERALNPRERHKLGAHYTPRAYVERLVLPTVIGPLRSEWQEVQAAALIYERQDKRKQALEEVRAFHRQLCSVKILDPACGSANFLYVTLEHLKRLEGEVLNLLADLGESRTLETEGLTVDPHQFLGLEINPRAAKIAEMVLWIGYLQWHFRTMGNVQPPEPVLRDFKNIENRDALIDYDNVEPVRDDAGNAVTRWDGVTTKTSPITGQEIPDETARIPVLRYVNPRKAQWPQADYIIGNPPFIGASTMRRTLGDGYVEAVRSTWPEVPESADFVMYWWNIAADTVRQGQASRFGFITTNSIKQTFNRRVIELHLAAPKKPLSLVFAIPDHPWVDSSDGAAVRIAMTVGAPAPSDGRVLTAIHEEETSQDEINVKFIECSGVVFSDLRIGANIAGATALSANSNLSSAGVKLHGAGFIVTPDQATSLGLASVPDLNHHIRNYRNGRDLVQSSRGVMVIDLFGLSLSEVQARFPAVYQWILERVKPERDQNNRATYRDNWWVFGEARKDWRAASKYLPRFIATVETAKHRTFQFLDGNILPDNKLVNIATSDAFHLGVLSSRLHVAWSFAAGSWLGVGNDSVYVKTKCFETYPFPAVTPGQEQAIRDTAEKIDAHRKRQQGQHPNLGLTDIYNVLEKLRSGEALTAKDKSINEQGLVSVLRELHDQLDRAVFSAYGWEDLGDELVGLPGATTPLPTKSEAQARAEGELLTRLVDLNTQRAGEEASGQIRWLRPDFQNPSAGSAAQHTQDEVDLSVVETIATAAQGKVTWPKVMREQIAAVRGALSAAPLSAQDIAGRFKRSPVTAVQGVLDSLLDMGIVQEEGGLYRAMIS